MTHIWQPKISQIYDLDVSYDVVIESIIKKSKGNDKSKIPHFFFSPPDLAFEIQIFGFNTNINSNN